MTSNLFSQVYSSETLIFKFLGFVERSPFPTNPGWSLRIALAYLRKYLFLEAQQAGKVVVRVLCCRVMDSRVPSKGGWKSRVGIVEQITKVDITSDATAERSVKEWFAVGWERRRCEGVNLEISGLGSALMMDPTKLADQAMALNLNLMRWRVLRELDLEKLESTRCLLLGAGTLGCYVACGLAVSILRLCLLEGDCQLPLFNLAKITFINSGMVSFSNPVR